MTAAGTRLGVSRGTDAFFALLTAEEETGWIGSSLFGRGQQKR